MKYIAQYNKRVNKYFARSLSSGKTISTDRLMEEIANASTVAPADVAATLRALCDAMRGHLCDGDKVKLDNIGTFYLMADASGARRSTASTCASPRRRNAWAAAAARRTASPSSPAARYAGSAPRPTTTPTAATPPPRRPHPHPTRAGTKDEAPRIQAVLGSPRKA